MSPKSKIHFEISERKILLRIFDIFSVLFVLHLLGIILNFNYFKIEITDFYWTIVLSIYISFFGTIFEMYNLQVASNQFQSIKSILLTASTTVLVYLLTPYFTPALPENRLQILLFYVAFVLSLLVWRIFYVKFFASTRFLKKAVLICSQEELHELVKGLEHIDPNYRIAGYVDSDIQHNKKYEYHYYIKQIAIDDIELFITQNHVSEIVVASQKNELAIAEMYAKLIILLEKGYLIREYTQVYESITQRIPIHYITRDFYKYFPFSRSNQNQLYLIFVRVMEILFSSLGLCFGMAILPLILLGNIIGNKGPLFYMQERVGKNGVLFKIYKLRSMIINAEISGAVFAKSNDSRITPFGKFLRRTRLDEIPQFINVIKGDMSIIGPRPERPVFVQEIAAFMPFYETRHIIKPGLTGWAQVNCSYGENIHDSVVKLEYDLYYIKHRSVFLDLNITLKTISTVLFYRGQ